MTRTDVLADIGTAPARGLPLDAFERRVASLVTKAVDQRAEAMREQEAEMEGRIHVQAAFERLADSLHRHDIRPRVETVARCFDNAGLEHTKTAFGTVSVCTLARTERFPATATLTLGVTFDPDRLSASVIYRLQIIPVLMEFQAHDALHVELEAPDLDEITAWLERHLEEFVETSLRVERDPRYQMGARHVDPVCGMQVTAASALRLERGRRSYYFCAPMCRERFESNPVLYDRHLAE